jgi:hypothetical protein
MRQFSTNFALQTASVNVLKQIHELIFVRIKFQVKRFAGGREA